METGIGIGAFGGISDMNDLPKEAKDRSLAAPDDMDKPNFYSASDYAGLDTKDASFYYGYECTACHVCGNTNEYCDGHPEAGRDWCFIAKIGGKEIVVPFQELQYRDMFDVVGCLLVGIGWVLAKHTAKASRSACQNSLYWAWLADMEKTPVNEYSGNDAEWWHKEMKHRYLCPIFIRDDAGYSEMIAVLHDIKDIDGYDQLRDGVVNLTSTTKCSVGQFSEYLGKIERFCHVRGIALRTDSSLYAQAMGK
jgi:hypothetical protein